MHPPPETEPPEMTANLPAPPNLTTLQLSGELWRMLAADPTGLEDIRRTPALVEECGRYQRQLDLMAEPAGGDTVARALAPLVLVFGLGDQATSPQFWKVYAEALGDLPRMALDRAASEWPKVGKFFPKPAEVRELALPHALAFRQAAHRARKATETPPPPPKPIERPSSEDIAEVMAEFHKVMADKDPIAKMQAKRRPSPQGRVDHGGVTAEMRALLADRYERAA